MLTAMSDEVSAGVPDDRAEIDRLRRLVGPNEHDYAALVAELGAAQQAVRDAEHANGELRAELAELRVAVRRARQDQYHVWRIIARPGRLLGALKQSTGTR